MAFSGGGGSGGVKSDINVTPLVDVVLVLLIIFIVTTPVLLHDIQIEIPKKAEVQAPDDPGPAQVIVGLTREGRMTITDGGGQEEIHRTDLALKLHEKIKNRTSKVVFVDFEDGVLYGDAVSVMDTCRGAGATTVALKMKEDEQGQAATP